MARLVGAGADVHATSAHGVTAMAVAVQYDFPSAVKLLARRGYQLERRYLWGG